MKYPLDLRPQDETMYARGWNDAIKAAVEVAEAERDAAYKAEEAANSLPSGYRGDGLRDIAIAIRAVGQSVPPPDLLHQK